MDGSPRSYCISHWKNYIFKVASKLLYYFKKFSNSFHWVSVKRQQNFLHFSSICFCQAKKSIWSWNKWTNRNQKFVQWTNRQRGGRPSSMAANFKKSNFSHTQYVFTFKHVKNGTDTVVGESPIPIRSSDCIRRYNRMNSSSDFLLAYSIGPF